MCWQWSCVFFALTHQYVTIHFFSCDISKDSDMSTTVLSPGHYRLNDVPCGARTSAVTVITLPIWASNNICLADFITQNGEILQYVQSCHLPQDFHLDDAIRKYWTCCSKPRTLWTEMNHRQIPRIHSD